MTDEERLLWRQFAASCMNCGRTRDVPDGASIEPWLCDRCCDNALDLSTGERYNQREPMLNPKIPPLDLPQPVQTVSYCRCGRRLGAQDPGEACSTCKWMERK